MTRDDIIRMAREAGWTGIYSEWSSPTERTSIEVPVTMEQIERFAALIAAAEREKLKHELLTLEKWKGIALAKDGDGRTVQEIQREARETVRVYCSCGDGIVADDGALCGTCVSLKDAVKQEPVAWHEPGAYGNVTVYKQWAEENGWLPLYNQKNAS